MFKMKTASSLLLATALLCGQVFADPSKTMMQDVQKLQHEWELIKYKTDEDKQEAAFEALSTQAHKISEAYAGQAEPLVWEAIILSTYAGAKGGLGALSLAEKARDILLQAEKINPDALGGSVYTSLGSLYYQVPGWPIGFGSDKKARNYLEKALQVNPNGIEANYFYGDFLYEEGEYEKALQTLTKALNAPKRAGREITDAGRRKEIAARIEDVKRQL
jgi:tetratricopeptide (TPR) repeat protein